MAMATMSAISSIDQHTKLIAFLVNKHRGRLDCMGLNSCLTIMHKCNARGDRRRPGRWFLQLDVRLPCACIHLRTLQSTDLDTAVRCRGSLFHSRRRLYVWEPEAVQHSRSISLCCVDSARRRVKKTPDGRAGVTGLLHLQGYDDYEPYSKLHAAASGQACRRGAVWTTETPGVPARAAAATPVTAS